ncbi:MAG: WD40 repeat domain-containing protein [Egibacteraceae bacterium]
MPESGDAALGEELLVLRGHEAGLTGVAWSPDAKRLATASRDGTARIWDAELGTQLAIPCVHTDWVTAVAWSPDGMRLATASRDHTAAIWDAFTDLDALVAKARTRVFHELTTDERRKLMLPERV